ncbi:MAG: tRNA 4-thiouridine(8) synthase ThiI [Bacilli bacterium]|nr:tRNA 4-thiouridine(8) synthase ThiI [Bacilli bacterium]
MNYDSLMIHYGELSTKGENRKQFIRELNKNIRHAIKEFGCTVTNDHDHTYVKFPDDPMPIIDRLQKVSGIQRISLVYKSSRDIETLKKDALELIKLEEGKTFKVVAKRGDKTYPLDSHGVNVALAGMILRNTELKVDVHNPDIVLKADVRKDAVYLSSHTYYGAGGYPLGMNGKVMMMLSGGIDSPVAAYLLLRRGIRIECIHFAAPPYTSDAVIDKLTDIIKQLNVYQEDIKLNIIPFTKLQLAIYQNVPEPYCITIMRRMMYRLAEKLGKYHHCIGIANGESVGQVASQTLDSMITINNVTNFPVIRPLAVSDKVDIIKMAGNIGTFDISIRPYEDCCTIFKPKKPKTKPRIDECEFYESKFDWQTMIEECIHDVKSILVRDGEVVNFAEKEQQPS